MKVICPKCNTVYNVPSDKIPKTRAVATCKKCGEHIVIEPGLATQPEPLADPPTSSASYSSSPIASRPREHASMALFVDYPELKGLSPDKFGLEEILFPNKKGGYKSRQNKFKIKVLKAVSDILEKILRDGEKVMRIGKGTAYYPVELLLGNGWLTMYYNYYAIVCTNQRVLLINIDHRIRHFTHYLFQIRYEEIEKIKRGRLSRSLVVYRMKGKRRIFMYVKGYIVKELRQFIMDKKGSIRAVEHPQELLENLCPSCFTPLGKSLISCPHCRVHFKEPKKAFLRSLLLPGLGDIYLGHIFLGLLELLGAVFVWAVVISLLLTGKEGALFTALFLLLFYNLVDGLLAYHMGKKGYMLAKK
jgi:predicted Zn finger-like uncharacterized protein